VSSRRLALGLCVSALAIVHGQALLPGAQAAAQSPQPSAPVSPSPETPAEGAAGIQPAASGPAAVPPSSRRLSNERTLTTWAHPVEPGPIYAMPETNSRRVGRVHLETEDGFPEVLWEDGERRSYRIRRNERTAVLPTAEHPTPASVSRLTHEYALRDSLDSCPPQKLALGVYFGIVAG